MPQSKIRPIQLDDLDSVTEIEENSFPNPWDQSIFFQLALSGGKFPIDDDTVVIMDVMGKKGSVIGYVVWEEYGEDKHRSRIFQYLGRVIKTKEDAEWAKNLIWKDNGN